MWYDHLRAFKISKDFQYIFKILFILMNVNLYKSTNQKANFHNIAKSYFDDNEYPDPPVDIIAKVKINASFLKKIINEGKEYLDKGDRNMLRSTLTDILEKDYLSLLKTFDKAHKRQFIQKTDICKFLLRIASNDRDLELQYYSLMLIERIMNLSEDAVNEFINNNALTFFIQLTKNPNKDVQFCAFKLVKFCIKTENGFQIFFSEKVFLHYTTTFYSFLKLTNPSPNIANSTKVIASTFCDILEHANIIPKNISKTILVYLTDALGYNFDLFFNDVIKASILIVKGLGNEGNRIISQVKLLDKIQFILESENFEQIKSVLHLLDNIFSQKNKEVKIELLKHIDQESVINLIDKTRDSKVYTVLLNIISNCFLIGFSFSWIIREDIQNVFMNTLTEGSYENKEKTADCILIAVAAAPYNICIELIQSNLMIYVIQVIPSMKKDFIKKAIQISYNVYQKILRFGLSQPEKLDNEILDVMKQMINDDDENIQKLASVFMKTYFPEDFYS